MLALTQSLPLVKWRDGHLQMRCVCEYHPLCSWQDVSQQMAEIPEEMLDRNVPHHRHLLARRWAWKEYCWGLAGRQSLAELCEQDRREDRAAELCAFVWLWENSPAEVDWGRTQFMEFRKWNLDFQTVEYYLREIHMDILDSTKPHSFLSFLSNWPLPSSYQKSHDGAN